VFGELAPKTLAIQRSQQAALFVTWPLRIFYIIFKPFIWVLNGIANFMLRLMGIKAVHGSEVHSSEELQYLVEQGAESGTIETEDYEIIRNAFGFAGATVKQIMTHHTRVFALNLTTYNESVLKKLIQEGYSRIPCYETSPDHITGVIYLRDLLVRDRGGEAYSIRDLVHPAEIVPESKRVAELLKEFQLKHQQMAVVVDELGITTGIITMEDIIEELVGEIQDEFDAETPHVQKVDAGTWHVLATVTINSINRILPTPITRERNYETLAGALLNRFGKIPDIGEEIAFDGYEFTVLEKLRNSILKVQVKKIKDIAVM
jgi:CBS domain containing-hemolysin-like protein